MRNYLMLSALLLVTARAVAQSNPVTVPSLSPPSATEPVSPAVPPNDRTTAPSTAEPTAEAPQSSSQPVQSPGPSSSPNQPPTTPPVTDLPATAEEPAPALEEGPRPPPAGPIAIQLPNVTLKFGFLLQPQYEIVGSPTLDRGSQNIFVRRTRFIVGATLFKAFDFFLDTDFPNLNRPPNARTGEPNAKATPGMNVQDAFATVHALGDMIMIDLGYMLPPLAHNAVQGATSLYGWDYFTNSFRHGNVFGSSADPVGRDTGAQLRGLVLDGHIEYRIGLFQGKREPASLQRVASRNFFRAAGRLQINFLDPEVGFFYAGSYLGRKRILSVGVSYDIQDSYHHSSADGLLDMPLGPGVITAQVDVSHWNGGNWVPLPSQTALMAEAGYLFDAANLSPIVRIERRWVSNETPQVPDETRIGGGLAFWPYGHNVNLKAFYTRVMPTPAVHDYNQVNVQTQFFVF